jgi:hypothetical protein
VGVTLLMMWQSLCVSKICSTAVVTNGFVGCTTKKITNVCYRSEGGATVGLLEQATEKDWEMFTCLNSLRDVEGTVDLVLDQHSTGLRVE